MLSSFYQYINDNYGSKRGFIKAIKYGVITRLGGFRQLQNIDYAKVKRLVFVCSGNICRSPLGEYVSRSQGIDSISFGLNCRGGDPADPRAIGFAKEIGIDMRGHITRNIKDYDFKCGDLIIGMEPKHINTLGREITSDSQKTIISLWGRKPSGYLHDPFNTNKKFFYKCENTVVCASIQISKAVIESISGST